MRALRTVVERSQYPGSKAAPAQGAWIETEVVPVPEVAQYKIGNSTVRVMDDACKTTQAEIDEILRRVSRMAGRVTARPEAPPLSEVANPKADRHP